MAAYISKQQQLHHQSNSHISGPSSGASPVSASGTPSMPQLTAKHTQSASPNSQQQLTPQLHHQQQAALLQAAQAEQIRAAMLATQMALPYQLYGVSNKQAQDLHRQYLLDMINQNRSWKTWTFLLLLWTWNSRNCLYLHHSVDRNMMGLSLELNWIVTKRPQCNLLYNNYITSILLALSLLLIWEGCIFLASLSANQTGCKFKSRGIYVVLILYKLFLCPSLSRL